MHCYNIWFLNGHSKERFTVKIKIIVNKVYPKQALNRYFSKWINLHEEGLKEIRESFSKVPVFTLMLQSAEYIEGQLFIKFA